jgi:HEAT repeat protein
LKRTLALTGELPFDDAREEPIGLINAGNPRAVLALRSYDVDGIDESLSAYLESPHPEIRKSVVNTFRHSGADQYSEKIHALLMGDPDMKVRRVAAMALGNFGADRYIDDLKRDALESEDEVLVEMSIFAIAEMEPSRARTALNDLKHRLAPRFEPVIAQRLSFVAGQEIR